MRENEAEETRRTLSCSAHGMPLAVKTGSLSAMLAVLLRAYHAWTVSSDSGALPLHLIAIFWVCASIAIGLAYRSDIARHAARGVSVCGMVIFTLGVLHTAFQLSRGNINPPPWLVFLTLLNPATTYVLFFSLGSARTKEYFARSAECSSGRAAAASLLLGLLLTASLYTAIRFHMPKHYVTSANVTQSIVFEIRKGAQQPVAGFSEMLNKRTGKRVYVGSEVAFSNDDLRSASVVERQGDDGQPISTIIVSFTEEAAKEFANFTAKLIPPSHPVPVRGPRRSLVILIDGEVLLDAAIREPVTGGRCFIPFGFGTKQDAEHIAKGIVGADMHHKTSGGDVQ